MALYSSLGYNIRVMEKNNYIVPVSILIAGLIIAGSVVYYAERSQTNSPKTPSNDAAPTTISADIKNINTDGEAYIGEKNAPVVMAYWFDFQCPFCKRFEENTLPALVEKYVKTGKLKIVFKDLQFLGSDSITAGLAKRAVWETAPKHYFEWQTAMFNKQDGENTGWGNKKDIINLIKTIPGLDAQKISTLMDEKKQEYQNKMNADETEIAKIDPRAGTPAFVIGKQYISGAQPIQVFVNVIEKELSK